MFHQVEAPRVPDALDLVTDVADMEAAFAAQRFQAVDAMRREAQAEAARHGRQLTEVIDRSIRLELAAALRVTEHAAGMMLARAESLVHRYPAVLESLSRARITERHAEILAESMDAEAPDVAEALMAAAIELAEQHAVGTFRRALGRLVDSFRAASLSARHEEAVTHRHASVQAGVDGMAELLLHVPAVEAHAIFARATAIAKQLRKVDGETRTLDQLRADVMCDLLIEGDTTAHPAQARGIRPSVVITVPALSLLDDENAAREPATVEGIGPIPIERARELCGGDRGWMRVLTHPETGMVLSVGRDRYDAPPALRKLVKWRAERCMAPGCGVPASRCQIDHNLAWEHGGHTALWNESPFCQGHHTVKHHGGWTVRQIPGSGGAIEWVSPARRRYVVQPERRVPVFRPADQGDPPF
ncbi:DUF222 domain-containing protein [Microbacterium sp.]|uniref:HNH endonuclease signature motif containing protein n=1 Tax=Microbacterium sp. TaxID=51671 RepID=UPI0037CA0E89